MGKTLFEKVWNAHVVTEVKDGPSILYIDKQLIHEVTSPQAFAGIEKRGIGVFRPERTLATPDHNVPTKGQNLPIVEDLSRFQVDKLTENCNKFGVTLYGLGHASQGVVHVVGPETGTTLPGMTIVCGDSHTSTHGAFGSIAFGIGTSEVEQVLATQCLMQTKAKTLKIEINGKLAKGVTAKDVILYVIAQISAAGGTGYFVEYCGSAITSLSMEARMTICNMSIEMGARGGMIAPDETTFNYIKGREFAPKGAKWDEAVAYWKTLYSDSDAVFDKTLKYDAADIGPMITYGTNPGMGISVNKNIPSLDSIEESNKVTFNKALDYMGFHAGDSLIGKQVNWVFLGSCTNGRIEDLRQFAEFVKGKQKAANINALIVPGSKQVEKQAIAEGIDKVLAEAGFELREPGCSACLAMNEDKVPKGEYCVSTSNRNFEGRQGPGARTLLVSPLTAAAIAVSGKIVDVREMLN
ncbi:3-isopropylmalate dehydratase large subunit [Cytophaga hutchinsonii]|jgi:3-isopropylmalate/(R)-2-methylmalate dehydratase large subunit|uniref:3-isopropylmalate dehydratase large subunit n=1 Tax=Cytophaga hutchinsonii (strain ATCC 33406 / DSM 1761 / CIP 103989 / NBRC 15051 / NCIMB 9469 / D465) TaxID=269798 RepID=LEUC_CYTH3|nr:3-isopropylmalate dehydratase large subunit [Cytophaga hutchinsonii]Q11NN8.1 RecName: Full=3-isopropylmalate dehydratase large subunit; AltName: Full=Alpha-IPM isomerase; Short=IPMI; AltName: Full=Isopropylmalate isomerase [Cytophaga hutchinsonii ATCC 33406]ABG60975.1 3-isopropylmalate dehydratase, large subunit [Cytophaga hutchinsonii ATCC 33406]SFX43603.1 3-isopropylmalate/(R)-2-methylmalate dehydratase large subunit [Cytophaga hutchinsonii ATCC 33406]